MKVLSLKQPYAELIVSGKKTIELRKWNTKFRGEFYIHASKTIDKKAMKIFGFKELPIGCIVGKAKLVKVKIYKNDIEHFNDQDKHLADRSFGKYGFVLKNIERVELIPAKGKLGFWEYNEKK